MSDFQKNPETILMVSESRLNSRKLKGKPKCPLCGNVLMFVYDTAAKGYTNQKCHKCGARVLVNLETLDCRLVVKDEDDLSSS